MGIYSAHATKGTPTAETVFGIIVTNDLRLRAHVLLLHTCSYAFLRSASVTGLPFLIFWMVL